MIGSTIKSVVLVISSIDSYIASFFFSSNLFVTISAGITGYKNIDSTI